MSAKHQSRTVKRSSVEQRSSDNQKSDVAVSPLIACIADHRLWLRVGAPNVVLLKLRAYVQGGMQCEKDWITGKMHLYNNLLISLAGATAASCPNSAALA